MTASWNHKEKWLNHKWVAFRLMTFDYFGQNSIEDCIERLSRPSNYRYERAFMEWNEIDISLRHSSSSNRLNSTSFKTWMLPAFSESFMPRVDWYLCQCEKLFIFKALILNTLKKFFFLLHLGTPTSCKDARRANTFVLLVMSACVPSRLYPSDLIYKQQTPSQAKGKKKNCIGDSEFRFPIKLLFFSD